MRRWACPVPTWCSIWTCSLRQQRSCWRRATHGDESKKDLHEADFQYLLSCREAALYAAERSGWQVLSCCDGEKPLPIQQIAQMIWERVSPLLNE